MHGLKFGFTFSAGGVAPCPKCQRTANFGPKVTLLPAIHGLGSVAGDNLAVTSSPTKFITLGYIGEALRPFTAPADETECGVATRLWSERCKRVRETGRTRHYVAARVEWAFIYASQSDSRMFVCPSVWEKRRRTFECGVHAG